MKERDAKKLKVGQTVTHDRYGECKVKEVMMSFGVVISPTTDEGKAILKIDSNTEILDFLEDSPRHLTVKETK
ncbi:MAG: hypothetical protein MUO31_06675 [Thermodesulfovibrionales bacterium]|nr:hypothetical protein [Thermodesulfovibrionales bacterium]